MSTIKQRIVFVSNRLPVTITQDAEGFHVDPSSGGLVTALRPLLNDCAGVWIGWTGTDEHPEIERVLQEHSKRSNIAYKPVFMSPQERKRFYYGFSNEVLWPLFHDLQSRCNFDPVLLGYSSCREPALRRERCARSPVGRFDLGSRLSLDVCGRQLAAAWRNRTAGLFSPYSVPQPRHLREVALARGDSHVIA